MKTITNITITNVKGFGSTKNSLDLTIKSGKFNILVASNGFGKSSITIAFCSLRKNKLELNKKDFHKGMDNLVSSISIVEEGNQYTADNEKNELNCKFQVFCIRNLMKAEAVTKNMGRFSSTTSYLGIEPITIIRSIPSRCAIPYAYNSTKQNFGKNGKVLPNISELLASNSFASTLNSIYSNLERLGTIGRQNKIKKVIEDINVIKGNKEQIKARFDANSLCSIKEEKDYKLLVKYLNQFKPNLSELDSFLYVYQLQALYFNNRTVFKDTVKRASYELEKNKLDENLSTLCQTWKSVILKEERNNLIAKFPHTENLSYGERDLLILCVEFAKIEAKLKESKDCILIIDEIFDYLDEANMTAAQYYLSRIVDKMKKKITVYPILMTHLNPERFNSYVFSRKKRNIQYLDLIEMNINRTIRKLLINRREEKIKDDVSRFLLHFSKDQINKSEEFKSLNLPELWGKDLNFLKFILEQLNKYFRRESFDPYSVCIALRIGIEKKVFDMLEDQYKNTFIDTYKTKNKLEYAEKIIGELPDLYYMLGLIYNDVNHLYDEGCEKAVIYRLNHKVIKEMISTVFEYKGEDVILDAIH